MAQPVVQFLAMPWLSPVPLERAAARGASVAASTAKKQAAGAVDYTAGLAKGGVETLATGFATATQPLANAAEKISGDVKAVTETFITAQAVLSFLALLAVGGVAWVYLGAPGASSGVAAVKRLLRGEQREGR